MAVTLDDAATKAPVLTINEFAALSLSYIVRYTVNNGVTTFPSFCAYIQRQMMPFVPDITEENSCYWHIEAQACGSIEIGEVSLYTVLKQKYAGVLGKGFDRQTLESSLPADKKSALDQFIIPSLRDPAMLQPRALRRQVFLQLTEQAGLDAQTVNNVWSAFENTVMPQQELIDLIKTHVPEIQMLFKAWDDTPMKNLKLTSVGLAIGHANAVRLTNFDAPLGIWIK